MDVGVLTTNPKNPTLPAIMAHEGVDVLSLAMTGTQFETDGIERLDAGLKIARGAGKKFTPRIRLGYGTPAAWKGRTYIPNSGIPKGKVIPCPVTEEGAPNIVFLAGFQTMIDTLADWVNQHMTYEDGPVHLSWTGGLSAEIYVSEQLMDMPGATTLTVADAHVALIRVAAGMDVPNPVELSISGLEQGNILKALQPFIIAEMVRQNEVVHREFWTQRNGFADGAGQAATTPHPSIGYGAQMVKAFRADGKPFDWQVVFSKASQARLRFLEVYDASFANPQTGQAAPGSQSLYAECAKA